jgi:hypothetical protein
LLKKSKSLLKKSHLLILQMPSPWMLLLTCNTTYQSYQLEPCGESAVVEIAMRDVVVEESQKCVFLLVF